MCSSLLAKISSTHNDCLAVGWSDVDFSWRYFVMPMCLQLEKKGHQNQKLFLLMKNIWKVLLSVALNNSPLQRSLTANFTKHPRKAMNPSLHVITEDTNFWCWCFFLFFFFFFDNLVQKNATTGGRLLSKCDIFSAVSFLTQVPVSSLHYTFLVYFI